MIVCIYIGNLANIITKNYKDTISKLKEQVTDLENKLYNSKIEVLKAKGAQKQ